MNNIAILPHSPQNWRGKVINKKSKTAEMMTNSKRYKQSHDDELYKVSLSTLPSPRFFSSYAKALEYLSQSGPGKIQKRSVIEYAFPLDQKLPAETWINIV